MKNIPLYKQYETPIAVHAFCNTFGIAIFAIGFDGAKDYAVSAWCNGENYYTFSRSKIHQTAMGREYIRKGNLRIYLDEFMKIGG